MPSRSRARLVGPLVRPRGARSQLPRRSAASVIILALGVAAFGCAALPRAGWAACNTNPNPPPASPPPKTSFTNQSFGTTPPLTPYVLSAPGLTGCVGTEGWYGQSGGPGGPGQQGGPIVGTNTGLTIIGGGAPDNSGTTIGASLSSSAGGTARAAILGTVNFAGVANPNVVSGEGVLVQSNGGSGGLGGAASGISPEGGGAADTRVPAAVRA